MFTIEIYDNENFEGEPIGYTLLANVYTRDAFFNEFGTDNDFIKDDFIVNRANEKVSDYSFGYFKVRGAIKKDGDEEPYKIAVKEYKLITKESAEDGLQGWVYFPESTECW